MKRGDVVQVTGEMPAYDGAVGFVMLTSDIAVAVAFPMIGRPLAEFVVVRRSVVGFVGTPPVLPAGVNDQSCQFILSTVREQYEHGHLSDTIQMMAKMGASLEKLNELRPRIQQVLDAENIQVVTHHESDFADFVTEEREDKLVVHMSGSDDSRAQTLLKGVMGVRRRREELASLLPEHRVVSIAELAPEL